MNKQLDNNVFFKAMFNTTSAGLAVIDEHGLFLEVNKKLCDMFGYNVAELKDQSSLIIFPENAGPEVAALQHSVFHNGESLQQTRWKGKTKEGSLINLGVSVDLFTDEGHDRFIVASFRNIPEEKYTNEATEATHLQYRSVIDNSMQGFFLTKPDGTILEANKAAEKMFGYSAEEFYQIGRNAIIDQTDTRLQEKLKERDDKGFTNGELICIRKNGERFPVEFSSVIFKGVNGEGRTSTMFYDISERKLAEHVIKVNEEQLNLIYNSTTGIIFLLGVENNGEDFYFISMNNSGLETIGAKPEHIFNKPVREVIPEPSFSLVITKYREAIQTRKSVVWQEETPYPTGTKTGIVTVTPIYDNEGNCVRLVGSVIDITELKETERSLAISRQQYKSLFDQNPDAVYSLDLEGNFTDFNPGLEKLLECSRQDIIQAATFVPFCHPDDLETTIKYFRQVQTGDAQTYDVRAITFTGKLKYISIINMPIMVDGKITGVYGIAKDITSEKLALSQLELSAIQLRNSNIELERFAYIASHDLQEPLRMITSFLQLLEKKYLDSIDEKGREYIRFAVDGSLRMKHLINDLLDYSRVSTSKQNLERVEIDLVMNDVLQNLSLQINEKQAVIKAAELPLLPIADKTQMIQLFQNLLSNALKYSGNKQPQIEIAAREQEDEWLFSVKDNGIGFDERFADTIFVIFHRLHNKSEYSGTGMGLAICKKIIDRHGGKIYAKSVPDEGSIFWFTIKKHLIPE